MAIVQTDPIPAESRTLRRRMTEEQFVAWSCGNELRAEWVDGQVQVMNAVEYAHVELTWFLTQVLGPFVGHHRLVVGHA